MISDRQYFTKMGKSEATIEYAEITSGIFSMAAIPVLCSHRWSNVIQCNLLSCLSDRGTNSSWNNCCTFSFKNERVLTIQWDHATQIRRQAMKTLKIGVDVVYALLPYYSGVKAITISVDLANPNSLEAAARFVRESSLFHARIGYDHRLIKNES